MNTKTLLLLAACAALWVCGCTEGDEPEKKTCAVEDCYIEATSRSAVAHIQISVPEGNNLMRVGVLVSPKQDPREDSLAIDKNLRVSPTKTVYDFDIPGLEPLTDYNIKPYFIYSDGDCVYKENYSFPTLAAKMINGKEFVNLGLTSNTKWAVFNVESSTKDVRHSWFDADSIIKKDWEAPWKLPSKSDWQELMDECVWSWEVVGDMQGMFIKGKNGNTLFLPADGYSVSGYLQSFNDYGAYWTADAAAATAGSYAILMYGMDFIYWYNFPGIYCGSVRAVNNATIYDYD